MKGLAITSVGTVLATGVVGGLLQSVVVGGGVGIAYVLGRTRTKELARV